MRVLVFGNSGSGKSTLSRGLAEAHGLVHLDLDTSVWDRHAEVPTLRPLADVARDVEEFSEANEAWVVEGCYADVLGLLAPVATDAVFLDLDVASCQANARTRPWEPHKYASREAQDANLPMLLDWIAAYETRTDQFSRAGHEALFDRLTCNAVRLRENPSDPAAVLGRS